MLAAACVLGCSAAPHAPTSPAAAPAPVASPTAPAAPAAPDPDLHHPPPRRLLAIDWTKVALTSDADALSVWRQIAPTGADWQDKLEEIPASAARPLALALVRGGNFACARPPTGDCARPLYDVPAPADTAGLDDPCLRRGLGLWAIGQLDEADLPAVRPALLAIAALPPPESQLVSAAILAFPEAANDARLELLATAWRAGQREVVESIIGKLDEPFLVEAVRRHHIGAALELLAAADHRAIYLAAITDEALTSRARIQAINELATGDDKLAGDLRTALAKATKAVDCAVAAAAARALDQHGDHRFVPSHPRQASAPVLMRAMCVLASYEALQRSDEPSLLAGYLPARGLERVTITYDALSETDPDGDGDPHTTHSADLIARGDAVLPEVEELVRAMQHCTGAICVSDDHELRFTWSRAGELTRIELADRPPCAGSKPAQP